MCVGIAMLTSVSVWLCVCLSVCVSLCLIFLSISVTFLTVFSISINLYLFMYNIYSSAQSRFPCIPFPGSRNTTLPSHQPDTSFPSPNIYISPSLPSTHLSTYYTTFLCNSFPSPLYSLCSSPVHPLSSNPPSLLSSLLSSPFVSLLAPFSFIYPSLVFSQSLLFFISFSLCLSVYLLVYLSVCLFFGLPVFLILPYLFPSSSFFLSSSPLPVSPSPLLILTLLFSP